MKRHRPWLAAVLGLLFLIQGFAVAAAEHASLKQDSAATGQEASVPCAGHMDAGAGEVPQASCCDADCDMASCAMGHLALATATPAIAAPASAAAPVAPAAQPVSSTPESHFRPPIAFHG